MDPRERIRELLEGLERKANVSPDLSAWNMTAGSRDGSGGQDPAASS